MSIKDLKFVVMFPLTIPHLIVFWFSSKRNLIYEDSVQWHKLRPMHTDKANWVYISKMLIFNKSYRKQFYYRIGSIRHFFSFLLPSFFEDIVEGNDHIGGGLVIVHFYGVGINKYARIGKNCTILHHAFIGFSKGGVPIIGDNVYIGVGAAIFGKIKIGNNVKIGAGATVFQDIPDNCTVVGSKPRIIENKQNNQ